MRKAGVFLGVLVAVVVLVEGGARVATTWNPVLAASSLPAWYTLTPDTGWEPRPGYQGRVYLSEREYDRRGWLVVDSEQVQQSERRRMVILGDSRSFGYGVSVGETYAELIDQALDSWDLVNLSVPGYSAYQGERMLHKRGLALAPALVVFSFDYNDRRYSLQGPDPGRDWEKDSRRNDRLRARLESKLACFRLLARRAPETPLWRSADGMRWDELTPRVAPESYRAILSRVAQTLQEAAIPIMFLSLRDNPEYTGVLRRCVHLADSRGNLSCLEDLAETRHPYSVMARAHLARTLERIGEESRATETSKLKEVVHSSHGGQLLHLDRDYSEIMAEVAAEHGVRLVDAGPLLRDAGLFLDDCHFNAEGHRLIAELLLSALSELVAVR